MLASEASNPNVPLAVHRDESTGRALIGAILDDVFVPFFETKLSLFDHFHKQGLEQKAAQPEAAQPADESQTQTQ